MITMTDNEHNLEAEAVTHVESRIKLWVLSGLTMNLFALLTVTVPMIYYLGSISTQFEQVMSDSKEQATTVRDLELWRQRVDARLTRDGDPDERRN